MPELLVAWVAFPAIQILIWLGCGSLGGANPSEPTTATFEAKNSAYPAKKLSTGPFSTVDNAVTALRRR